MTKGDDPLEDPQVPADPPQAHRGRGQFSRLDTLPEHVLKALAQRTLSPGDVVAERYRLIEKLGEGAMGDVFVADNLTIGLRVALKLLKPDFLLDREFRQRFQREAQAIASVEHNYVARFYDVIVGNPTFIVMEFVRGETLAARLRGAGRLAPETAVPFGMKIGWALAAAHAAGVIHRDLKPANVILTPDLECGEIPKLIDFGLAKLPLHGGETLTRTGQIVGTPSYMSPEQIIGEKIDARSDVYALGCVIFDMIAGRPPFVAETDMQVLYKQMHEEPVRLSSIVPEVSPALDKVVACALSKKPEGRFASMSEMIEALARVQAGFSQGAATAPLETSTLSGWRRKGATIALAAAALLVGFGIGHRAPSSARSSASRLFLLSTPPGAEIEIDGKRTGARTPSTIDDLTPGSHAVVLSRAGSQVRREMTLAKGESAVMEVNLPPIERSIQVVSVPGDAMVWLDGALVNGNTPLSLRVTTNTFHELRIQKTGYETSVRAIRPEDHEGLLTIRLDPERESMGTLVVDSNAAQQVFIDGVFTGLTTPTLPIRVRIGEHEVSLRDSAGQGRKTDIVVGQGETVRLTMNAQPLSPGTESAP